MPEGQPLPADLKLSLGREPAWDLIEVRVNEDGRFAITNLPPEAYELRIRTPGWRPDIPGWRPDLTRMNFQGTRYGSFAVYLTKSLEDLRVPMVFQQTTEPKINEDVVHENSESAAVKPSVPKTPEQKAERPKQHLRDEPIPEDGPKLNVHGTVVSPEGERLAGIDLMLLGDVNGTATAISPLEYGDILAHTTTDTNGRFIFTDVPIPPRLRDTIAKLTAGSNSSGMLSMGARVLATQTDRGLAWAEVESLDTAQPLRLVLGPGATVTGKIVDPDGQGIAGTRIKVEMIAPVAATLKLHQQSSDQLFLQMSDAAPSAISDAQGNFTLRDLPAGRHILAQIEAPGFEQYKRVAFDTTPGDKPSAFADISFSQLTAPVTKSPAKITLNPVAQVAIRVLDATGRPVTDGEVSTMETNRRSGARRIGLDANGQAIVPVRNTGTYTVSYTCEPLKPRVGISVMKELSTSKPNELIEIRLPAARQLTGRVVSAETGEPVVGAWVRFTQPGAENPSSATCISTTNGEFALPVVSGPIRLALVQQIHGFHGPRFATVLNVNVPGTDVLIPAAGDIPPVTLKITPGLVIEGTVVDESGNAVQQHVVRAEPVERSEVSSFNALVARTDSKGQFRLAGMPPAGAVKLTVIGNGATAETIISADPEFGDADVRRERVQLTLRRGVELRGRVLRHGQPVAGATASLQRTRAGEDRPSRVVVSATTDNEGWYVLGGLEPGDAYLIRATAPDGWMSIDDPRQTFAPPKVPANPAGPIDVPDIELIRWQQSVAGIVVDPEGNPVTGVQIYASLAKSRQQIPYRENASPSSMTTGPSGRFRFEQLPEEPIQLTAYVRTTLRVPAVAGAGTPIRFPAELQSAMNQTDIRMVLDPRLAEPVEDLDRK